MRVTRLPQDPGETGWNALLPAPGPVSRLESDTVADFLIIGAGFAGLAAGYRLRQLRPAARIAIVDARRVGEGPAGRNSGFMIDLPHDLSSSDYGGELEADRVRTEDNRRAIALAAEMAEAFGLSGEAYQPSGKVNAAATDKGQKHNQDYAAHLARMGEAFELWDAARMRAVTGSTHYVGGLYTPGTAMLQPAMFVRGVADGLRAGGTVIYENSPVLALNRSGNWIAATPKGSVSAPTVILAVNGHLNSFGHCRGRLMHVFTYASMTEPLSPEACARLGGAPVWGVTPADPMGTTVRRISGTGGDRIVIRNRFTYDPKMTVSDRRLAQVARDHDRSFAARFPMLDGTRMAYRWGGRLCLSRNGVSVVRALESNLYAACVQNGLGTARGTLGGMLAAELACGEQSPALQRALDSDVPQVLPPEPLSWLGANAVMRWQEFRAGAEL